jgi:hypothetical protein
VNTVEVVSTSTAHDFILEFHKTKFYFISFLDYRMKWNLFNINASFIEFYCSETVYTGFYIDGTSSLSFFISKEINYLRLKTECDCSSYSIFLCK